MPRLRCCGPLAKSKPSEAYTLHRSWSMQASMWECLCFRVPCLVCSEGLICRFVWDGLHFGYGSLGSPCRSQMLSAVSRFCQSLNISAKGTSSLSPVSRKVWGRWSLQLLEKRSGLEKILTCDVELPLAICGLDLLPG